MTYGFEFLRNRLELPRATTAMLEEDSVAWRGFYRQLQQDVRLVMDALEWVYQTAEKGDEETWNTMLSVAFEVHGHYEGQRADMRELRKVCRYGVRTADGAKIAEVIDCDFIEWLRRTVQSREAWVVRYGLPSEYRAPA